MVLSLDGKVHIKSNHSLKCGKFVFIPDSLFEMPIGYMLISESPYFSHHLCTILRPRDVDFKSYNRKCSESS